jgi:hypothetical protein
MLHIVFVASVAAFLAASPAVADYRIRFTQLDGAGNEIESGTWECREIEMTANRCTRGVMLVIDDHPAPIEFRLHDDGGILRVTMAAGAWVLAVRGQPILFHRKGALKGVAAGVLEPWETEQRIDRGLNDLTQRYGYRSLAGLTLIVEHFAED